MSSDIPGVTLAPTVPRASWHGNANWQCQDSDGLLKAHPDLPFVHFGDSWSYSRAAVKRVPAWVTTSPGWVVSGIFPLAGDWTKSLRRIVDENLDERLRLEQMLVTDLRL